MSELKRGFDIKCFEDLPPDVQATIRRLSESNEEFQKRTGIAIAYQHLFPNRYHCEGLFDTNTIEEQEKVGRKVEYEQAQTTHRAANAGHSTEQDGRNG